MKKPYTCKIGTGILAFVMSLALLTAVPQKIQAAGTGTQYQAVAESEFAACFGKTAPVCTLSDESCGYLFAGWYNDGDASSPIRVAADVQDATKITAKFVPARLTGIACQNKVDAAESSATKTNMRIVSTVDSTNYQAVGFNVYGRSQKTDGTWQEWKMYEYAASGDKNKAESSKVYSGLKTYHLENGTAVADDTITKPEDVFGSDAAGFLFTTISLSSIPKANYSTTIAVKPYWITLDGTYVEGIGEFDRVQDGIDGIVNVSVNLKNTSDIAAGLLSVEIPDGFTFVSAECGRVFDEMTAEQDGNRIKCVGNVADVGNTKKPNEVFVNLKLKKTGEAAIAAGTTRFKVSIPSDGFCDISEQLTTTVCAWDVAY